MDGQYTPSGELVNTEPGIHRPGASGSNRGMDWAAIRLANLKAYLQTECGGNAAELARRIRRSPSQTNDLLQGRKAFGEKLARSIEDNLGLFQGALDQEPSPVDLARRAIAFGDARGQEPRPVRAVSRVPVISWVAAGAWQEAFDPYAPGDGHRWEELAEQVSARAFALEVRGDSMEDPGGRFSFPEGCLIVLDPERKLKAGDFAVFRNNDWDEATFKQYVVDGGQKLLKPLNPRYRAQSMPPGTVMVGVVTLKIEKQRF